MAFLKFGHFNLVSKLSWKLFELETWHVNREWSVDDLINFWKQKSDFVLLLPFENLGILTCKQDISKTVWAIVLKLDRLIGNDE